MAVLALAALLVVEVARRRPSGGVGGALEGADVNGSEAVAVVAVAEVAVACVELLAAGDEGGIDGEPRGEAFHPLHLGVGALV